MSVGPSSEATATAVPQFEINLDSPPEDRFTHVVQHFKEVGVLDELYSNLVNHSLVQAITKKIAAARGPENEELMGEIRGIASTLNWPVEVVQSAQILYELQTLMVPITNFSWPWLSADENLAVTEFLNQKTVSFGCTGIIARSEADGTVYHARNLDFSFAKYLQRMAYNAVFIKGGKHVYTAQMIAVYQMILTGMRPGPNGYSFEVNTRYYGHMGGNKDLFRHLFRERRTASGWVKRKILESVDNFEEAVEAMSTRTYAATEYNIMSGVKKGIILARDPDGLVYSIPLRGDDRYIIMTNFDYIYHDIKEWFDPTGVKGIGHSRRIGAEKILNSSATITPELLYSVLNNDGVMAKDTIFQAIINIEKNAYNTSLPPCKSCGDCVEHVRCRKKSETCCTLREHYTLGCDGFGGYRCGCLADGQCRFPRANMTEGDEDCCSSKSHFTLECPSTRRCG
jgi:hypothetical protein